MSIRPEIIDAMVASGCSVEQIAAVVRADHQIEVDRLASKRAGNAERQRRYRNASNALRAVTERDTPPPFVPPDKEAPKPQEITPPITPHPAERERTANPSVVLQSVLDPVSAQSFVAHCSEKRKPLSSQQAAEIVEVLRGVRAAGANPVDAVRLAIGKGWTTIDLEWLRNAGMAFKAAPPAVHEDWAGRMQVWRESRTWGAWGPPPGERGCRVPAELVDPQEAAA